MFIDQLKTVFYLGILSFIFLIIGFAIGGNTGIIIALIFSLIINTISYWYSDKIVLKIYNAHHAEYSQYTRLHDIVIDVSTRASIHKPKLYIINSQTPNAFATGRNEKNATIVVTEGILTLLNDQELKAVIAHEIAHIKNKDLLISTVSVVIASAIAYIALLARIVTFSSPDENNSPGFFELLLLTLIAPISATILRLAISRSREYVADDTGAKIIKDADSLSEAIIKIENSPKIKSGNPASANLFIVNPFSGKTIMKLLSTHPSTNERIKRLRKLSFN
ncbi:zinc metalloprotease HtpX [Candidatus Woesearchaeota archaeon]|nr:zinc metalloprotease HtpX [Candidatus Woesearchaeota archaeon]